MHRFFTIFLQSTYTKYKTFETWSLLEVFSYSWIVMLNLKVSSYCTTGFRTADILNYFKSIRVRPFHSFVWVFKLSLINCSEARFYGASGSGLKLGSWNWQIASCSPTNSELFFLKQFINNCVVMVLLQCTVHQLHVRRWLQRVVCIECPCPVAPPPRPSLPTPPPAAPVGPAGRTAPPTRPSRQVSKVI